jgi:predicted HAD superfamily Cof-like phosphohydrolase
MTEWQKAVRDSHAIFGHLVNKRPTVIPPDRAAMHVALVNEEADELAEAVDRDDLPEIADACVDLIYVTLSCAVAHGIDLEPIFSAVHASNMAKAGGEKRADGKQLKPPGWKPADVNWLLWDQGWDGR